MTSDEKVSAIREDVEKDARASRRWALIAWVALVALGVVVAFTLVSLSSSRETWRTQYSELWEEYVDTTGQEPVAPEPAEVDESDAVPGTAGAVGPQGPPPTDAQVRAAVSAFCAETGCDGPAGPGPSAEDVLAAVTAYCADDTCRGEPGEDGAAGPGPTADDILAAVAAYCASGACTGPEGPVGPAGEQGAPGSPGCGIASTMCDSTTARWVVTYTDGETVDAGPCLATPPVIEPTPDPAQPGEENP